MVVKGMYGEAKVFADNVEEGALQQIKEFLDQDYPKDKKVRIMPDVHQGIGCVIGLTAKLGDVVVPNLVGVDIGCGMLTIKLGENCPDPAELDRFIRKKIPSGTKTHRDPVKTMAELTGLRCFRELKGIDRIQRSIGTLGGGNHFIEVGRDSSGNHYLVIHSGSRRMARDEGAIESFRESMKGIYSTSVHEGTIDESPFSCKPLEEILERIGDTVQVTDRIVPIYNFKA